MASFYGGGHGDYLQAVVADIGQAYTKVGWAGNDSPKAYFRSVSDKDFASSSVTAASHSTHFASSHELLLRVVMYVYPLFTERCCLA